MRLAGDQINRPWGGGAKCGSKEVIAQSEVLRVVPEGCNSIAIEVVHHQCLIGTRVATRILHEPVHKPVIESLLLIEVMVILVAGQSFRAVKPMWIGQIRIVCEQYIIQPIDRGG